MNRSEQEWHDQELDRAIVDGEDEPAAPPGITSPSPERDVRLDDLLLAYNECERYAGKMEATLELILETCCLALRIEDLGSLPYENLRGALRIIEGLAQVRDDRRKIYAHAPSEQG